MSKLQIPVNVLGLGPVDPASVVAHVALELSPRAQALVRDAGFTGVDVSVGKVFSNHAQSECGVYLQHGLRVGAVASIRAVAMSTAVEVKVGPLAKLERWLVWLSLGLGLVVGCVGAAALLPTTTDPRLELVAGLFAGVVLAVAAMLTVTRLGVGRDDLASQRLVTALEALVQDWRASKPDA